MTPQAFVIASSRALPGNHRGTRHVMTNVRRFLNLVCVSMVGLLLMAITSFLYSLHVLELRWMSSLLAVADVRRDQFSFAAHPVNVETTSYPWVGDPTCQHHAVQFAKNQSRPKWALTSFPGSGVTWTRQLIEGVTGIYTGTVHGSNEPPIVSTGHYGNWADLNCDCTILIKDHDGTSVNNIPDYLETTSNLTSNPAWRDYYQHRGILLIRNPIDTLFTYAHYLLSGNDQKGTGTPEDFAGPHWDEHVDYVALAWADHAKRWIQNIKEGTVVFYERLLQDTENELRRLLKAIHFTDPNRPPVDPERMRCTLQHKNRSDRKRTKKLTVPLSSEHYAKLMSSIDKVQRMLLKKGWPPLPIDLYDLRKPDVTPAALQHFKE
ncbi:hypothetical protein OUZ56_014459 [Daphnia magna]|uniref:Sulfotransferase domain-containing protein n=1 Tax=Daphnia magna TaxID=35525 RepID=A0ABR0AJU1_9CRUS|nr:hypothetical protein OUZ56_014459 [Daphnia magna]